MKCFMKSCGVFALVVICFGALGVGFLVHRNRVLDSESRAYVEMALPAIASSWEQTQLMDRASPALRTAATPERLATLFEKGLRLGSLVSFEQPIGRAIRSYTTAGSFVAAVYDTKAKFQNGDAVLKLVLVKVGEHWMVNGFGVQPLTKLAASHI